MAIMIILKNRKRKESNENIDQLFSLSIVHRASGVCKGD
jgi:hypothetical protein